MQKTVEKAAGIIKKHEYVRVVSHYDADGITSAGIICNALLRRGIQFHTTIVSKLERSFIQGLNEELIIFCDMGTAQLGLISEYLKEKDVIIIDHHTAPLSSRSTSSDELVLSPPSSFAHINPYLSKSKNKGEGEIEGEVCAAGLSYLVARCLSDDEKDNIDLAGLAVAGALGDKLEMDRGINKMILDEAIKEGVISLKKGLKLGDGKIRDLILFSADPYIPLMGKVEWVDAFLDKLGIEGDKKLSDLEEREERRLTTALLSLSGESKAGAGISEDTLVGITYILNSEVVRNGLKFMRLVDACGRFGKAGIGIGLCLREERMIEEATSLYIKFQSKLVSELNRIESGEGIIKELPNIFYFYVHESGITGVLAGIVAEYLYTGKPVIALNKKNRAEEGKRAETRISARCNKKLVAEWKGDGIDLAKAMEKASKEVEGFGGGHPVASGASIPEGSEDKFIATLDRIIGKQKTF
ncbi:MAG: DHH family phosphoesterase [Methanophagales archaeon]|nr:DHH family phosphoesterase [Methanophagales archaeon]